jgi:hypothetical protein
MAVALAAFAIQEYRTARERQLKKAEEQFKEQQEREKEEAKARKEEEEIQRKEAQSQAEVRNACLAEIELLRSLATQNPAKAAREYHKYRSRTEAAWKAPDVAGRLVEIWKEIQQHPWQRLLIEEAVNQLVADRLDEAQQTTNIVHELDPNDLLVQMTDRVIGFVVAQKRAQWLKRYDPTQLIVDWQQWQRSLLAEAAVHFANDQFPEAQQLVEFALLLDPTNPSAKALEGALAFAIADGALAWLQNRDPTQLVADLELVDLDYGETRTNASVRRRVVSFLASLITAEHIDALARQLGTTPHGLNLLREPECTNKLIQLAKNISALTQAKATAEQLLARCQKLVRWVSLWPPARPAIPQSVQSWLGSAELDFDPFGPEVAELDPLLPDFAVLPFADKIRGARPVLTLGQAGSGRTAAALLLAFDCNDPLGSPREPSAFPVHCPLRLDATLPGNQRTYLEILACATQRAIVRYLALKPGEFFSLAQFRQEQLGMLLLTCSSSFESLERQLREAAQGAVSGRLLVELERLGRSISTARELDVQTWLDLLSGALPHEFEHLYLLVDISHVMPGEERAAAAQLDPLVDLSVPLAARKVYLKMFAPESLGSYLGSLDGISLVTLNWRPDDLRQVLAQRIHQASRSGAAAGRYSLQSLCDPDALGMKVDEQLIGFSKTPRDIVRLGNRLLQIHIEHAPNVPQLNGEDIMAWQDEIEPKPEPGVEVSE